MTALDIAVLDTTAGLEALASAWHDLWCRCPSATPFQSPAWLVPWWRFLGEGTLAAIAVRRGGRLVGLLPLYHHPRLQPRRLFPLGIGQSDYLGPLIEPAAAEAVAPALLGAVAALPGWEVAEFQQLRPGDPLLAAPAPPGLASMIEPQDATLVLALAGPAAAWRTALPRKMQRNLSLYGNRAAEAGGTALETATADTLAAALAALVRLHTARWTGRGEAGVLAEPAVVAFHGAAAPRLLARGLLRLMTLRIGGRPAGALYGLVGHGRFCAYLSGIDPAMAAFSPGTLLFGAAIAEAAAERLPVFDFLRGGEPYKRLWGATPQENFVRRLVR